MFKLKPELTMKLIKQGWITQPIYKGNRFIIINPDNEEETYTFTTNNQIVWFLRGFESGLNKTEVKNPEVADVLKTIDEERKKEKKNKLEEDDYNG